jgi:hypothetical protein
MPEPRKPTDPHAPASPAKPWPLNDVQPHVAPSPAPDVTPAPSPDDLTADALRHSLDRGRGGDKTDFADPAAAPLGTDDEASGHPPGREQLRMAAAAELAARPDEGQRDRRTPGERLNGGSMLPLVLLVVLVVVALLVAVAA